MQLYYNRMPDKVNEGDKSSNETEEDNVVMYGNNNNDNHEDQLFIKDIIINFISREGEDNLAEVCLATLDEVDSLQMIFSVHSVDVERKG